MSSDKGEPSEAVRERVLAARAKARARGFSSNSLIPAGQLDELAPISDAGRSMLKGALADGRLSARGLARVRMVARTIADLANEDMVSETSIASALALRARPALFDSLGATHV
jgi:magnesium chelatase family protein